jgi:hypothetical protein
MANTPEFAGLLRHASGVIAQVPVFAAVFLRTSRPSRYASSRSASCHPSPLLSPLLPLLLLLLCVSSAAFLPPPRPAFLVRLVLMLLYNPETCA